MSRSPSSTKHDALCVSSSSSAMTAANESFTIPKPGPDRLTRAVELIDEEIATPDAETLFLQLLHEFHD